MTSSCSGLPASFAAATSRTRRLWYTVKCCCRRSRLSWVSSKSCSKSASMGCSFISLTAWRLIMTCLFLGSISLMSPNSVILLAVSVKRTVQFTAAVVDFVKRIHKFCLFLCRRFLFGLKQTFLHETFKSVFRQWMLSLCYHVVSANFFIVKHNNRWFTWRKESPFSSTCSEGVVAKPTVNVHVWAALFSQNWGQNSRVQLIHG